MTSPRDSPLERLKEVSRPVVDLDLARMSALCAALGHPERRLPPVVHIGGTNGKGSTAVFVRAIAEAAGLRVHVYTSPHLVRLSETTRLAGRLADGARLTAAIDEVAAHTGDEPASAFETLTAAALLLFAGTPADLCVLEVGLGGARDATNVVSSPAVSVLTIIADDHCEFLGKGAGVIAVEKAGIIKPGRPVVVARQHEAALAVIEAEAGRRGAPMRLMGRDFDAWLQHGRLAFQHETGLEDLPPPGLAGAHQVDNAGLALAALQVLNDPRIDARAMAAGVAGAVWPARMQRLTAGPYAAMAAARGADLWLDGGHNPHAARALARTLAGLAGDGRPVALICGLLANKDAAGFFSAFADLAPTVTAVGFDHAAAGDPEALAGAARAAGLAARTAPGLAAALDLVLAGDGPAPHVMICGSLYLAGEVLAASPETWPA